jgi:quinol monooxygenase YgiN
MLVLVVTWKANPGHEDEVAEIFRKLESASCKEPGCLGYTVHRHVDDPRSFLIYEQYRDEAALQAHRDSVHFQEHAVKALRSIGERQHGDLYRPLREA